MAFTSDSYFMESSCRLQSELGPVFGIGSASRPCNPLYRPLYHVCSPGHQRATLTSRRPHLPSPSKPAKLEIQSSKSQILNKSQFPNTQCFKHWELGFVICLEFRYSCFEFLVLRTSSLSSVSDLILDHLRRYLPFRPRAESSSELLRFL